MKAPRYLVLCVSLLVACASTKPGANPDAGTDPPADAGPDARPLKGGSTGASVRVRSGRRSVTDGPFIEAKEIIGGFFLIEADSLEAALEVAAAWPSARLGAVEVRPIEEGLAEEARY